ncbi:CitMHS family transporter [Corynebacterium sp.]|uniref:CitMHS family transporter n=1 Tax=Corynebacterium sp. TaxID=1720 RepID=UPI002649AC7F|nr:citrate:proton symporter [Corynebacterium sp.]MDN5720663.1 citrate:proton symporter [Corynebacterium sp.]
MLALYGFLTVGIFLALTLFTRTSVLVGLVLVPIVFAVLAGHGGDLGDFIGAGLLQVAPIAVMMTFAILFFSVMMEAGLFDPLIRRMVAWAKGDPVKIAIGTALVTMCVHLDGDGAATFLITLSGFLPIYRRIGMRPIALTAIVALGAGLMNMLPWGGPTIRAMAALDMDASEVFTPMIIPMIAGGVWVLVATYIIGRMERKRIGTIRLDADNTAQDVPQDATSDATAAAASDAVDPVDPGDEADHARRDAGVPRWRMAVNLVLTLTLVAVLFTHAVPMEVCFIVAFTLAACVNIPKWKDQQKLFRDHGANVVLVTSMVFAAGVFTGILGNSGMIENMAQSLADVIPESFGSVLPVLVSVVSMPLSLVFTPDAFYFGVLPVFAHTAEVMGADPAMIARGAIAGQMTTGFPLSPLTASTFILIGMAKVELGKHQRFTFLWAWGTTIVITVTAVIIGALTF